MKQALVFAAGLGTRLKPLTNSIPKVLVEINGKTILARVIEKLINNGFERIVVNTHYFADKIRDFIDAGDYNAEIIISHEKEILETGGGLVRAKKYFEEGDILIHNGDILSDINLAELWDAHKNNNAIATLASFKRNSSREFLWNPDGELCGWRNLLSGEYKWSRKTDNFFGEPFAAIHVVDKMLIDLLPADGKFSLTPHYIRLAKDHKIKRWKADNTFWFDIGSVEKLREAENYSIENSI